MQRLKFFGFILLLIAAGFGGYLIGSRAEQLKKFDAHEAQAPHADVTRRQLTGVELGKLPGELELNPDVIKSLNIQVAAARQAPNTEPLVLAGSLFLDSSHLAVVHTRFTGEVVRVGDAVEINPKEGDSKLRQVRAGDFVKKNDIIAVIWSKEIGEKKSDLVESLSRRNASKATLDRLEGLEKGSVSGQVVRDARRQYESDLIAIDRHSDRPADIDISQGFMIEIEPEIERTGINLRSDLEIGISLERHHLCVRYTIKEVDFAIEQRLHLGVRIRNDRIAQPFQIRTIAEVFGVRFQFHHRTRFIGNELERPGADWRLVRFVRGPVGAVIDVGRQHEHAIPRKEADHRCRRPGELQHGGLVILLRLLLAQGLEVGRPDGVVGVPGVQVGPCLPGFAHILQK